ncbi:urease accessory protein UreD [Tsukamurella pseudospumae]|uniref:Urease accessory protein UreD n=1 Tax=Tsukamurella pseudospumae TaxID=239498 RepID=A0A138AK87_9ACTN|nr:urease accessory protein UreD [Tsukamurella pseudospumae]KXP10840.1 urease accessory protein UreD [Tsukamurella pseudospumae]
MNGAPAQALTGELVLTLAPRGPRTVAVRQRHGGTLQTLRPLYLDDSGQVTYHVVNPGGGCLRGDTYAIDIDLEAGARVVVTTQSATKVYRTPDGAAAQHMRIRLGPDSVLEYVPDALILYREATYRQTCTVELDESASLVLAEIVTPGWSPDGARFRYGELRMRTEIHRGGRLLAVDNLLIEPGSADPSGVGFLDGRTHVGSLTAVDPRVDETLLDDVHALTEAEGAVRSGLTALAGPGFVLRCLGDDTAELARLFDTVIALLRSRWTGQAPLNLRKY